jgi:signal transduction histidine kinase
VTQGDEVARELHELLYALTHDLAAPLRVIDGFSEALLDEPQSEAGSEYLNTIRGSVSDMNQMFDGILQLHRVSQAPLRRTEIDVTSLAESIAAELQASEPAREVRFDVERDLVVNADPALFRIALAHLLGNAWKFTSKRTDAAIAVGREDAALFVRDHGAGFDSAAAGRIFTPFQRFHPAREFGGLGIGLAVVRRMVHRHGGCVRAASAFQQGTTIYMELP